MLCRQAILSMYAVLGLVKFVVMNIATLIRPLNYFQGNLALSMRNSAQIGHHPSFLAVHQNHHSLELKRDMRGHY